MIPKLKDWLEKQGYPLEMKVAKELSESGFYTMQSSYYTDSESEKNREIDVVGQLAYTYKKYKIVFQLIIECKNNASKPWITFSSNTHSIGEREFLTQRPGSLIGTKYHNFIAEKGLIKTSELFVMPKTFAYNVTQAFENDSDRAYSALMSVLGAVKYRKEKINSDIRHNKNCEIYYPIIVLGGRLFDCFLDEKNESIVEEVSHKYLLWKNNIVGSSNTVIEITTFDSFKSRLKTLNEEISDLITQKSNDFFEEHHSNDTFGYL